MKAMIFLQSLQYMDMMNEKLNIFTSPVSCNQMPQFFKMTIRKFEHLAIFRFSQTFYRLTMK